MTAYEIAVRQLSQAQALAAMAHATAKLGLFTGEKGANGLPVTVYHHGINRKERRRHDRLARRAESFVNQCARRFKGQHPEADIEQYKVKLGRRMERDANYALAAL